MARICAGLSPSLLARFCGIGVGPLKPSEGPSLPPGPLVQHLLMAVVAASGHPRPRDLYLVKHLDLNESHPPGQFAETLIDLRLGDAPIQETSCSWPVSDARLIVSRKR